MSERYAIYYTLPSELLLYRLADSWLACDDNFDRGAAAANRASVPAPLKPLQANLDKVRHYGFHATLKAPFRLKAGTTEQQLSIELSQFAAATPAFTCPPLKLSRVSNFIALIPSRPCQPLNHLSQQCVEVFDYYRAKLSAEERSRREENGLTARQRELLELWGYPYVFDEFRFHMTLTDQMNDLELDTFEPLLRSYFSPALSESLSVDRVSLCFQGSRDCPFEIIAEFPLA